MANNIYSAYHYACKTKADREAIEKIVPEAYTAAQKAVWGNIGDIKYTTRTSVPGGCYWCDGKTIAKSELTKVYEMLIKGDLQSIDMNLYNSCIEENGSCGLFGLDKEKEIFRIPMLNDVYLKMGQDFESFKAESLPNITGWFNTGYLISETNGRNSGGSIQTPYTATASKFGGSDPSAG